MKTGYPGFKGGEDVHVPELVGLESYSALRIDSEDLAAGDSLPGDLSPVPFSTATSPAASSTRNFLVTGLRPWIRGAGGSSCLLLWPESSFL